MQKLFNFSLLFIFILLIGCSTSASGDQSGLQSTGYIENKGSDTMVNLALAWAEEYQHLYPNFRISVTGGGSGTGIAALINGTVDIANASRQIKNEEIDQAKTNNRDAVEFVVARDAIAVIVHLNNPINQLTLQQISDIYSGKITNWNQIGGDNRPVVRLSRETNSGTHVYFLEEVLRLGEKNNNTLFALDTLLLPSSEGITKELLYNENAIGYDGLGYVTPEVKVLAIAKDDNSPFILPSAATVNSGEYPIARDLYMYTSGEPTGAIKEYIDWIYSSEAQTIVTTLGFVSIGK